MMRIYIGLAVILSNTGVVSLGTILFCIYIATYCKKCSHTKNKTILELECTEYLKEGVSL